MADDVPQTTDVGHMNDQSDADSGIGTGSNQTTPSQSSLTTPSNSEMNTPVLSPTASGASANGNFPFPPEALNARLPSQMSHESTSSAMETDSIPDTPLIHPADNPAGTARSTTTTTTASPPTKTGLPQMNRDGFFVSPEPTHPRTNQIFVRNYNGKVERFEISETASVTDLRKMVHNKMGVPPSQQRLNYQGRELQDGKSLASYGVRDLSEMNLLGRLRGGSEIQ
ncbi:ubiquitin [Elysia marginata]|uniref:Ubiquitin n=1 Tax=Elysia marginata TaxID=1093978 RepID=A0AAV4I0D8_9GAST|nr:ubiquitin [Elysia marginata]